MARQHAGTEVAEQPPDSTVQRAAISMFAPRAPYASSEQSVAAFGTGPPGRNRDFEKEGPGPDPSRGAPPGIRTQNLRIKGPSSVVPSRATQASDLRVRQQRSPARPVPYQWMQPSCAVGYAVAKDPALAARQPRPRPGGFVSEALHRFRRDSHSFKPRSSRRGCVEDLGAKSRRHPRLDRSSDGRYHVDRKAFLAGAGWRKSPRCDYRVTAHIR